MNDISIIEIVLSFIITWTVVLVPPILLRYFRGKPFSNAVAITISIILYFMNVILFTALGSQSKSHLALLIGAYLCYRTLSWTTRASQAKADEELRKSLGYDDNK